MKTDNQPNRLQDVPEVVRSRFMVLREAELVSEQLPEIEEVRTEVKQAYFQPSQPQEKLAPVVDLNEYREAKAEQVDNAAANQIRATVHNIFETMPSTPLQYEPLESERVLRKIA